MDDRAHLIALLDQARNWVQDPVLRRAIQAVAPPRSRDLGPENVYRCVDCGRKVTHSYMQAVGFGCPCVCNTNRPGGWEGPV